MKILGYLLFSLFFHIFRLIPVSKDKVFFIATHDNSQEGNIGVVRKALEENIEKKYRFVTLTRADGIRKPVSFFIIKSFHMATATTIFMDNIFLPMAYLHFSKRTRIVQLWHGTDAIKRFGQSVNTGTLGKLEYKANQRMTHLIVSSPYTKAKYKEAFRVPDQKIYDIGLPRTDLLFDKERLQQKKAAFFREFSELEGKEIFLYAPTFRDDQVEHPEIALDLDAVAQSLGDHQVLLLRLHPHVASSLCTPELLDHSGKIINVSMYCEVTTLLYVADVLITDYSSIVYEYSVWKRPMIFYAYDLEQFEKTGRDFYEPYETYVPGTIARTQQQLFDAMAEKSFDEDKHSAFVKKTYQYLDDQSTKRLLDLLGMEEA